MYFFPNSNHILFLSLFNWPILLIQKVPKIAKKKKKTNFRFVWKYILENKVSKHFIFLHPIFQKNAKKKRLPDVGQLIFWRLLVFRIPFYPFRLLHTCACHHPSTEKKYATSQKLFSTPASIGKKFGNFSMPRKPKAWSWTPIYRYNL